MAINQRGIDKRLLNVVNAAAIRNTNQTRIIDYIFIDYMLNYRKYAIQKIDKKRSK